MLSNVTSAVAALTVGLPGAGRKSIWPEPGQGTADLAGSDLDAESCIPEL
jgi:hypothetical protein